MNKVLKRVITALASGASIVSLAFVPNLPQTLKALLVGVGIFSVIYLIYSEAKDDEINETVCHSKAEIKKVMRGLVQSEGKVAIMSRDLSWVDQKTEECISMKKDDVLICVQKETDLTKRLADSGVDVRYYGHTGFEPVSRFTIIRHNKKDLQVAIANTENQVRGGKKSAFKHVIYQTLPNGKQEDIWINSLAKDMISLCSLIGKETDKNEDV